MQAVQTSKYKIWREYWRLYIGGIRGYIFQTILGKEISVQTRSYVKTSFKIKM
jgi:hypothetical protein